jgi:hypothetical protein
MAPSNIKTAFEKVCRPGGTVWCRSERLHEAFGDDGILLPRVSHTCYYNAGNGVNSCIKMRAGNSECDGVPLGAARPYRHKVVVQDRQFCGSEVFCNSAI